MRKGRSGGSVDRPKPHSLHKPRQRGTQGVLPLDEGSADLGWAEGWARGQGYCVLCGVDEVGRGPLAGPVVAGAVILDERLEAELKHEGLDDSKRLNAKLRERLARRILAEARVGLGAVLAEEIDRINILQASLKAMRLAILALIEKAPVPAPDCLLIDGNQLIRPEPLVGVRQTALIKGDCRSFAIAAASVVAKVTRDQEMGEMEARYPGYGFEHNMGYPTAAHRAALKVLGPCPIHRRSFRGVLQGESADV